MADFPEGLLYSEEHEYLKATDDSGVYMVGITDYAQGELGDIVYLELPGVGDSFGKMEVFGTTPWRRSAAPCPGGAGACGW